MHDRTPMHTAAYEGSLQKMIELHEMDLLQRLKGDVSPMMIRRRDSHGLTPMYMACWNGRIDAAKWLYENGAADDLDEKNAQGITILQVAALINNFELSRWLVSLEGT